MPDGLKNIYKTIIPPTVQNVKDFGGLNGILSRKQVIFDLVP